VRPTTFPRVGTLLPVDTVNSVQTLNVTPLCVAFTFEGGSSSGLAASVAFCFF
jgi:hypothetical protein